MKDTLIVVPAYNEEKAIGRILQSLIGFDENADILVVNDGSQDRTLEAVRGFPVKVVSHPINLGYGAALQTAYRYATQHHYKYVVQFDADGQHNQNDLRHLIAEMRKDEDDLVIGSRVLGDKHFDPGIRKRIAFLWFTALIRILTGRKLTDPTSGLRGLSRAIFSFYAHSLSFPNDFPDADTLIHMFYQGYKIKEFPISSRQRNEGVSMHSGTFRHIVYMLKVTISIAAIMFHHLIGDRRKSI